jgi:Flagellar biosynthesis protein, FliO
MIRDKQVQVSMERRESMRQQSSLLPVARWSALAERIMAIARRLNRSRSTVDGRMEVMDTLPLGGKKSLLLVRLEQRRFVVAVSGELVPAVTELAWNATSDLAFGHARIRWAGKRPSGKRESRRGAAR